MVVSVLVEGLVCCFVSLPPPLRAEADVGFDEIVFPGDGERYVAVDRHVQLPVCRTCEDEFVMNLRLLPRRRGVETFFSK